MTASRVIAIACDAQHRFSKARADRIELVAGLGVAGDAHQGRTVQHRSRVAIDPGQPNLRQVHLIQSELLDDLNACGFAVAPAALGENITTAALDLLGLPQDTLLRVGPTAILRVTGLRNPCAQIDRFRPGLLAAVLGRAPEGALVRKAGIMAVVETGGIVRPDDPIVVALPPLPHRALQPV